MILDPLQYDPIPKSTIEQSAESSAHLLMLNLQMEPRDASIAGQSERSPGEREIGKQGSPRLFGKTHHDNAFCTVKRLISAFLISSRTLTWGRLPMDRPAARYHSHVEYAFAISLLIPPLPDFSHTLIFKAFHPSSYHSPVSLGAPASPKYDFT